MEYAGLDVSKESIVAVWKDSEGNTVREGKYPNSPKGLEELAALLLGCKATVESSTSGQCVYERLSKLNVRIVMANPAKIRLISESDRKTDRNDAEILANLLRANLLPTCYVPDEKVRRQRDLVRERKSLVEMNVSFKNRIRAALAAQGLDCPYTNILGNDAQGWLENAELKQHVKEHIMQLLRLSNTFLKEIQVLDALIAAEYGKMGEARLLDTIPGIAKNSAVAILSEIGDIRRFDSPKKLCSYAGLVPRIQQSGNTLHAGHVKHGNEMLKKTLVENAQIAAMRCKRFRKFYLKIKKKRGHQKAVVAVARKLATIIWYMLQRNEPFEGAAICHTRGAA
jgi:transposase